MNNRIATAAILSLLAASAARAQDAPIFGACESPATYDSATLASVYVPMSDGVRIAVDVILPAPLGEETRIPTVLTATRYWRAVEGRPPVPPQRFWTDHGYAVVTMDVRGTGASFGAWRYPWSRQEVRDIGEVIAWVVAQPWSDGQVGAIGTSYTGNTAQLAAATGHPAVKAVIPRFMDFDVYTDLAFPGGIPNEFLLREWGAAVAALDRDEKQGSPPLGVRPVDEDRDGALLTAALRDHAANPPVYETTIGVTYRDDRVAEWEGLAIEDWSTHTLRPAIEASGVPIYGWASWLDAGTADGLLKRYLSWRSPQRAVIGPWSHGGGHHASPYLAPEMPTTPSSETQAREALCFFDQHLRGRENGMDRRVIAYYTLGEERWKTTERWPPAGTQMARWYLREGNLLSPEPPAERSGADEYPVDFDATTGTANRWYTQLGGGDVIYPDRAEADRLLLTYTSAPLARDVEVTGHAVVTLHLRSSSPDGAIIVYLEDVVPDGPVTYVTEGHLRVIHRKLSSQEPPYHVLGPYRSFRRKDGAPLVPGEPAELAFALYPTSVLFRQGHRIRIAIAGADRETLARIPAEGVPVIHVERNAVRPSFVELPVMARAP
jgi:hypothetical protein